MKDGMKRTVFVEFKTMKHVWDQKTIAHIRIARFAKDLLPCADIVTTVEQFKKYWHKRIDNLVFVYGSRFGDFDLIKKFVEAHPESKIFWLINEYELTPNSTLKKIWDERGVHVISNFSKDFLSYKGFSEYDVINLNVSAYREDAIVIPPLERKYDLLYFGRFRQDRKQYFKDYLEKAIISTSKKNIPKWRGLLGKDGKYIDKVNWNGGKAFLRFFRYSLYLEDVFTHSHFSHLADRFYEALSYGVLLLFDKNCKSTIELSGYPISGHQIVENGKDMWEKIDHMNKNFDKFLDVQEALKKTYLEERETAKKKIIEVFK